MNLYKLSKQESKRITLMRAICILMVIFLHQYTGSISTSLSSMAMNKSIILDVFEFIISRIITFSAVPLFYLISSVLLYSKNFTWKNNLKKKCKTLALPYFLWTSIYILIYFIGQTFPFTANYFTNTYREVAKMSIIDFIGAYIGFIGQGRFVNALWFLEDLFILNIFAIIIKKIVDFFPRLCLFLTIALWLLGGTSFTMILNTQSFCFWVWGYYIVKYDLRMSLIDKIPFVELLLTYLILIIIEYRFYMLNNILRISAHGLTTIIGIFFIIKISDILLKKEYSKILNVLYLIAKYSFFIYASHDFVQTILKKLSIKIFFQTNIVQLLEFFLIPILVCFICGTSAYLLNTFFPSSYLVLSGDRNHKKVNQ